MTSNQRCGNRQLLFTSIFYISTLASILPSALSFSTFLAPPKTFVPTTRKARSRPLFAGGFEWEDPTEEFDQVCKPSQILIPNVIPLSPKRISYLTNCVIRTCLNAVEIPAIYEKYPFRYEGAR